MAKIYFSLESLLFFQKIFVFRTSQVLEKWSYNFHSLCQNIIQTLINRHLRFFTLDIARKNWPKSFIHWKDCPFFQSILFSTTSQVLDKWSYDFRSLCQNTIWTLINRALRFLTLDNARKNRPKSFRRNDSLYSQKYLISTTSYILRKWSYNLHSLCQNTLWTVIKCPLMSVTLDNARKSRPKPFIQWKDWLFFKTFLFSTFS